MRPILPLLLTFPAAVRHFPAELLRPGSRFRLMLSALGVALAVGLVWYLVNGQSEPAHPHKAPPVIVARAQTRNVTIAEQALGTVLANATVQVTSQVEGKIASAAFQEGQIVHTGDILFRLDQRPFQAALAQARANMARDQAQYVSAQRDRERYTELAKENAVSAQQRDQIVAQAGALAGTVKADKAAVDLADLNLQYSVTRSPIDGKTGAILIQPGNLVKANDTNPMVVITQVQPVKISFFLPQGDLPRIQQRAKAGSLIATVQEHGAKAERIAVPVDFVGNAVNAQTGTIELRATFDNADFSLVPGQLVDVSVALDELQGAIVVPHEAVNIGPNGRYVYVIDRQGNAQMRPVTVLYEDGKSDTVSGKIRGGDRVITDGQLRVVPGKPVTIVKPHKAPQ